jgi:hypothetical protein
VDDGGVGFPCVLANLDELRPPISAATKQATTTARLTCTDGIWAALITIDLHYN